MGETTEQAADLFFPSTQAQMNVIGSERGCGQHYDRATYDDARSLWGALYVGTMPHREIMHAIELLGTRVAPIVRKELARQEAKE